MLKKKKHQFTVPLHQEVKFRFSLLYPQTYLPPVTPLLQEWSEGQPWELTGSADTQALPRSADSESAREGCTEGICVSVKMQHGSSELSAW